MDLFWEIAANVFNTVSILLAGRNNVHTWWTGIVGCAFFMGVFWVARLYADVTLQAFFLVTSVIGWGRWRRESGESSPARPVRRTRPGLAFVAALAGVAVAAGYGFLLRHYTNAYAPFLDSVILAFSVLGQFLLVDRRIENWWCWLLVNTLCTPLCAWRGLYVTSALYAAYWVNALLSLRHWQRLLSEGR